MSTEFIILEVDVSECILVVHIPLDVSHFHTIRELLSIVHIFGPGNPGKIIAITVFKALIHQLLNTMTQSRLRLRIIRTIQSREGTRNDGLDVDMRVGGGFTLSLDSLFRSRLLLLLLSLRLFFLFHLLD